MGMVYSLTGEDRGKICAVFTACACPPGGCAGDAVCFSAWRSGRFRRIPALGIPIPETGVENGSPDSGMAADTDRQVWRRSFAGRPADHIRRQPSFRPCGRKLWPCFGKYHPSAESGAFLRSRVRLRRIDNCIGISPWQCQTEFPPHLRPSHTIATSLRPVRKRLS